MKNGKGSDHFLQRIALSQSSEMDLICSALAREVSGEVRAGDEQASAQSRGTWYDLLGWGVPLQQVISAVFQRYKDDRQIRAFVFFSLEHQVLETLADLITSTDGLEIIYATRQTLTETGKLNLIELCYGDRDFFTEKIQRKMAFERFSFRNDAVIIFYKLSKDPEGIRALKDRLRASLSRLSFERRIHGTDDERDSRVLLEAFTNSNSIDLINRVRISRNDRIFTRIPDFLRYRGDWCADGSSPMELYGLRQSRDLDIITSNPDLMKQIRSRGLDLNNQHYSNLSISHDHVIGDPYFHVQLYGFKFTSLGIRQLLLTLGPRSTSTFWGPKKHRDLVLISGYYMRKRGYRVRLTSVLGTLSTQLRIIFDFLVLRVMGRLPSPVAVTLRRLRARLRRSD